MGQYMYAVNEKEKIYSEVYKMKINVIEDVVLLQEFLSYCYDKNLTIFMRNEHQLQELIEDFDYTEFNYTESNQAQRAKNKIEWKQA